MESKPEPENKTEENLIEEYLEEVTKFVKSRFNEKKSQEFTSKWILRQLTGPVIEDEFDEEELEKLKTKSASEVHSGLLNKDFTYGEVVKKYHTRKAKHRNKLNSLTWSRFAEPLANAQKLDGELFEMTKAEIEEKYPLLGFVMSIKDSVYMKDTPNTCGLFLNLDRVPTRDPQMIRRLRSRGAVLTSKGNVPQLLFSAECGNHIFGPGLNPLDPTRTSGGSSGGEAALVALGFNNAAIGTDIGGSVRIPSFFCGISGLKPTSRRVSTKAQASFFCRNYGSDVRPRQVNSKYDKQFVIPTCLGPLARKVEDLQKVMAVLVEDQSFDRNVTPIPWRRNPNFPKKVGVFKGSSLCELCPTAKRAIDESIQALLEAKYEVVEFDIEELFDEAVDLAVQAFGKNKYLNYIFYGDTKLREPIYPLYKLNKQANSVPTFVLRMINSKEKGTRKGFLLNGFLNSKDVSQQDLMEIRDRLYYRLVERMEEAGICALLAPGLPTPAFKLGLSNQCLIAMIYTFVWNFFDVPAGALKVCEVREDEQDYQSEWTDETTNVLKENLRDSKGMPIGVSVVGKAFEEEIVLEIMKDIQDNLGKIL